MNRTGKLVLGTSTALLAAGAMAGPAQAAPNDTRQRGLVNVAVTDTTIQVPIAVAANICAVTVNLLASQPAEGAAPSGSAADGTATRESGGDNQTRQNGLVNIALTDTVVQIPLAVAANVCDVTVNVLAQQFRDGAATCTAVANAGSDG